MAETKAYAHSVEAVLTKKLLQNLDLKSNGSNPTYQVDIRSGIVGADDGTIVMEVSSPITISLTSSGANGLDTGSEASDTWYYIWLIYNPTTDTTAGLFSTSSSSPTMPSGYTKKRLISAARNDASSNLLYLSQYNNEYFYREWYNVLAYGTATTWTAVSITDYVPDIAVLADLFVEAYVGDLGGESNVYFGGISGSSYFTIQSTYETTDNNSMDSVSSRVLFTVSGGNRYVYYYNVYTYSTCNINVLGFVLNL